MQRRQPARSPAAQPDGGPDARLTQPILAEPTDGADPENPLSEREMEVSRLLVTGATNTEIARELTISPHTVKVHLRNVFEKLQVSSRTEASMVLLQRGWIIVPGVETAAPTEAARAAHARWAAPAADLADPAPLADLPPGIPGWQRIYLSLVLGLALIAAFAPFVWSRPGATVALLSDSGQTAMGRPPIELLPRWEARPPLSQARSRMAVAMDTQLIYVIGGESHGGKLLPAVDAYDLQAEQWRSLPPLPFPLANSAAALLGNRLYIAGGAMPSAISSAISSPTSPVTSTAAFATTDAHPITAHGPVAVSDHLLVYVRAVESPHTGVWARAGSLPAPLAGAQLVADGTTLYLLGGWDGAQLRDEVWAWRPDPNEVGAIPAWQLLTRLPTPLAFFGAVWVDGTLYVAGGYDGQAEQDRVFAYRIRETNGAEGWQPIAPLNTPRAGFTLAHDSVTLLALGGGWTGTIPGHERYDSLSNQWSIVASPIAGEWRHLAAVSRDGVIHLLGGWSGDYLDTHLQYQSSFRALLPFITSD